MSVERQETKKPTCVGFFVEQNLLITLQVRRLEQQAQLRQQVLKQAQLQQQVPGQVPELQQQVPEPEPGQELRSCYRRLRTGLTMQLPEQNISFFFPFIK